MSAVFESPAPSLHASARFAGREAWLAPGAFLLATWAWVMWAGKDVSWDVLNHHLYLPFSLFSGRFATDLFAAGPQSYQNPLAYLPFYALARPGLPSWLVGTLMAVGHAAVAMPLWALAERLWPLAGDRSWRWIALALAWLSPVFLLMVGTSSTDPWSNVLVLASLAALLAGSPKLVVWSGVLMALALAVKLTNVVFALPLLALAVWRWRTGQATGASLLAALGTGLLVLVLTIGPWAWWLWGSFGNPFFPLFNHWFKSPFASTETVEAVRFMMSGPLDLLTRPFQLAAYRSYNGTEAFAPDLRPAVLALLTVPAAVWAWRARARAGDAWRHPAAQVGFFTAGSYVLWLLTSGNTRYALPLLALTGMLIPWLAQRSLPKRPAKVLLGLLIALQALYYGRDGEARYAPVSYWDNGPFLRIEPAERLKTEPYLHLSVGSLSMSVVAPYLDPRGMLINAMGQWSLPLNGPLGDAFTQRLKAWEGRTRVLVRAQRNWAESPKADEFRERMDRVLYRLSLRVDWRDCLDVQLAAGPKVDPTADKPEGGPAALQATLVSCALLRRTVDDPAYEIDRATADRVLDTLEARCPKLLRPRPMATDADLGTWQRRYVNSDSRLTVSMVDGVMLTHFRSYQIAHLGSVDEILAGGGGDPCAAWLRLTTE